MIDIEIWLKWWTESNDGHSDASTGMYYGIYATLLCLGIASIGVDCWCVFTLRLLIRITLIIYVTQVHVCRPDPTICGMASLAVVGGHNEVSQATEYTVKR